MTIEKIDSISTGLSCVIKYKNKNVPSIVTSDLKDEVIERRWIRYSE